MTYKSHYIRKTDGASSSILSNLKSVFPTTIPQSYVDFLTFSNGGEWEFAVTPYLFVANSAEEVIKEADEFTEFFPNFLMIGSNGAGEYIAFDLRQSDSLPVVALDMMNCDLIESVCPIAEDFSSFLDILGK